MRLAEVTFERRDSIEIAHVSGEVDMSNADELGSGLAQRLDAGVGGLIVDLSAVSYLDSAAIHMLFDLREQLEHRGLRLSLVVPGTSLMRQTLDLAGVGRTIPVADTPAEAMDNFGKAA